MYARMRHMHHHPGWSPGPGRHRARRGAVRASVLRMLGERPMHGYEIIAEFEERTGGRWKPSPGSVYPTLAQLEEEGLVSSVEEEGRKRYAVTDAGRAWIDQHADEDTAPWERAGLGGRGDLRRLSGEVFGQLRQLGRFGSSAQLARAQEILRRTRADLYAVLASPEDEPADTTEPT